jgi:hypothetical protein
MITCSSPVCGLRGMRNLRRAALPVLENLPHWSYFVQRGYHTPRTRNAEYISPVLFFSSSSSSVCGGCWAGIGGMETKGAGIDVIHT